MKHLALLFSLALAFAATSLRAEPVTLTNADAARLFTALRTTAAGTTALNTRNGALDINALRPVVEAYEAGQQVIASKGAKIAANDPEREAKVSALNAEAMALTKAPNTVNLTLFSLSDEEIRDAKVAMDALAELLRFLSPSASAPPSSPKK